MAKRTEANFASESAKRVTAALGKSVRNARMARGWSRHELAERAMTSPATLQRLESGGVEVAMGTWLSVLDVLDMLSQLKIEQLHDPVAERLLDQTRTKLPLRAAKKDLDF